MLSQPLLLPSGARRSEQIDAEAVCTRIAWHGKELGLEDREDLISHLIGKCWEYSLIYQPGIIHKGFGCWVTVKLQQEATEWRRRHFGRTKWTFSDKVYERTLPQFVPLDDRPEELDPRSPVDGSAYRLASELRRYGAGDSPTSGMHDGMGEAASRLAA